MNTTATMMNSPRQISTGPLKNKRKEGDGAVDVMLKPSNSIVSKIARPRIARPTTSKTPKPPQPVPNNQLLAGYLAHEFITKGTLFGKPWDPARAEAVPLAADKRRPKPPSQKVKTGEPSVKPEARAEKNQMYAEVANLLKEKGTHLPGIVNPTQLTRFLQL